MSWREQWTPHLVDSLSPESVCDPFAGHGGGHEGDDVLQTSSQLEHDDDQRHRHTSHSTCRGDIEISLSEGLSSLFSFMFMWKRWSLSQCFHSDPDRILLLWFNLMLFCGLVPLNNRLNSTTSERVSSWRLYVFKNGDDYMPSKLFPDDDCCEITFTWFPAKITEKILSSNRVMASSKINLFTEVELYLSWGKLWCSPDSIKYERLQIYNLVGNKQCTEEAGMSIKIF